MRIGPTVTIWSGKSGGSGLLLQNGSTWLSDEPYHSNLPTLLASWHLFFQQVPYGSGQENQGVQDSNLSLARSIAIVLVTTPTWLIGWSVWGWQK
jgi:hypothetical protein